MSFLTKSYVKKKVSDYDHGMAELFNDMEKRWATSFDGTRIAYRVMGEGMPIILSPGVFTTYMFFEPFKSYFSKNHKIILWDYRGHPDSEVPKDLDTITVPNCAKDLKAVMDDAGVETAIHVGFSMGVMTILEFYKLYPKRVLGMVPINGPYGEVFSPSAKVMENITDAFNFMSRNTWLVEWFRPVLVLPINIPIAKKVELNPTMVAQEEMTLYFEYAAKMDWRAGFKALAAMSSYNGEDIIDTINVPTLLICGTKDSWTPKRIADDMHRRIKNSEFTSIPGGSHATPAENPEMINMRIDLFLREHFVDQIENWPAKKPGGKKATAKKVAGKKVAGKKRGPGRPKKAAAKKKPASKKAVLVLEPPASAEPLEEALEAAES
jgi:pimeloyl-ACP methyl ester carboxylesterase